MRKQGWQMVLSGLGVWACLVGLGPAFATINSVQTLSTMEQQLFSHPYATESVESRLDRIENTIFGTTHANQPVDTRLNAIQAFLKTAQTPVGPVAVSQPRSGQTSRNMPAYPRLPVNPPAPAPEVSPGETDYPTVSTMEQRVFHRTFPHEPLESRLARLEQKTLGQVQQGNLSDRTDRLQLVVLGDTGQGDTSAVSMDPAATSGKSAPNASTSSSSSPVENADMQQALIPVEKKLLHQTYPQEPVESRLNRLEMKVFNATAPEMSPQDRLYRIVSVVNAHGSPNMDRTAHGVFGGPGRGPSTTTTLGTMLLMILMSLL